MRIVRVVQRRLTLWIESRLLQIECDLKAVALIWLLVVMVPSLTIAQSDRKQDMEQCLKAQTPAQCQAALPACERVLTFLAQASVDPNVHDANGRFLNTAAWCEKQLGHYAVAEEHLRSVLTLERSFHGPVHHAVSLSLNNLAVVLQDQEKYEEAEILHRQGLAILQKLLGTEHPDVAISIDNLAVVLEHRGKYEEAEILHRQGLAILQKLLGTEHPDVATSLNNLALVLDRQGKYEAAETLHRQGLAMRQKLLGAEHSDVATSLNNLAGVLLKQGKFEAAEKFSRQGLAMRQRLLGAEHPDVATSLNDLAGVLEHQGKFEAAESLYRQGLAMRQRLLGAEHPDVATSLNNLALVLLTQGKDEMAETLLRLALEMRQKLLGVEHRSVALSLSNLAVVLAVGGKCEAAESLLRQGLERTQKLLGAEHPEVAERLGNLASVLQCQGKYEAAETLSRQGLEMQKKLLGAEHPMVARSLNNLASLLFRKGKYDSSESLYRQALAMTQKLLGAEHPDVVTSLTNLAYVLMSRGQFPDALPLFTQAAQIEENLLRTTSSETRMRTALGLVRRQEDALYGLLLEHPSDETLKRLALTTALLRKGRAAEAGTIANRLLHQSSSNRQLQEQFVRWQQVRQTREAMLYGRGGKLSPNAYHERLKELSQQADDLESQLAAQMPELRQLQPPKFDEILPAVAARLPKDGLLVEVVRATPYNFKAKGTESHWGVPHYVGMVLSADQKISVNDLGEASIVDSQVQSLLAALQNPSSAPKESAQAVYSQILKQLLPPNSQHVYLSLDGALSLVPFDALHDGTDYLLGHRSFHYLTSGRDLLRTEAQRSAQTALVLADPDFGKTVPATAETGPETFYQRLSGLQRLPGAQREAAQIGRLLASPPLIGVVAKESAIRSAHAPWVLHIASHGLFLKSQPLARPGGRGGALFGERKLVPLGELEAQPLDMRGDADSLSRSALVLAGAAQGDQAKSAAEDGLLTADEARSLDLFGTQLVVLSACDTGQGELSVGQGVYGLRRAFMVAGAETLVTSLWQVNDATTGKLMELYYQKLLKKKKGRLEGMQEAMKEMRTKYPHPYYWAPFLVIGSDGPLRPLVARPKGQ